MSAPSGVHVETRGAVALVSLNRPEHANTLDRQMSMDLLAAALTCAHNTAVRAVVLTGAGRNFCFGGDLRAIVGAVAGGYLREVTGYLHAAISHFVRMDPPVIAAVNGTAAGAGVGLAAMADLALCGESSKFTLAYTNVGLVPDGGTSFFLPRIIGARRTMELLLLNRTLPAPRALEWGLVNEVVADDALLGRALALAAQLAHGPTSAFGRCKRLVAHALGALESHLALESEAIAAQAVSATGMEGMRAFLEKRQADFAGSEARLRS
jgi:2-(1,2-epoxy-1,2-dihydrophenyl)acetyl-CoA isomerase